MSSLRYQEFIAERTRLLERIKELATENAELRKRFGEPVTPAPPVPNAMQNLSLQDKIELLCSLFNPNFLCLPIDLLHKISKRCIFASPKNPKKVYGLMV